MVRGLSASGWAAFLLTPAPLLFGAEASTNDVQRWTTRPDMLVFFQAVQAIETHALRERTGSDLVRESLESVVRGLDPYSDYLAPDVYAAFQTSVQARYNGIGMELCRRNDGRFECVPYPDSPAARAGVRERDLVIAVDGAPADGWSLEQFGSRIRGAPGTAVELTLLRDDKQISVRVTRAPLKAPSVVAARLGPLAALRVYTFRDATTEELRQAVLHLPEQTPVLIDLRGNPGGDPYDAADAANLFLEHGRTLLRIRSRSEENEIVARRPASFPDRPLVLLQDERTASAAEVFIAAVVAHRRALSIGRPTFGKGVTQRVLPLLDGSAIVLTDAELLTPTGDSYHQQGLPPSLEAADAGDLACLDILRKLPAFESRFEKINPLEAAQARPTPPESTLSSGW